MHIWKEVKHTALHYAIGNKLDQRPEFWKNLVMTLSSCIYEFGTTRYKGRNKKSEATESLKIESKKEEEYSYDEESYKLSVEMVGDDDEDYIPWLEYRRTRSSLKLSEQKPQARYTEVATSKDSNISIYLSGSVTRD